MFAYRYTDTNSTPKENSNPRNYHKSKFYCPGCDGNSGPAGWGGGGLRVGRCLLCLAPTQPQGEDAFILPTRPTLFPESSHPIFSLLSPEIRPHPLPTARAPEDLWLVGGRDGLALCAGLAGSRGGLFLTTCLGWWVLEGSGCGDLATGTGKQPEGAQLKLGLPLWAQIPLGSEELSDSCSLLFILFLLW